MTLSHTSCGVERSGKRSGTLKLRTQSLFIETNLSEEIPLYTLKDHEHKGYPSLYQLFISADDPMEREFAKKHIPGGYLNWNRLCESPFFKPHIAKWREELDTIIRAKALLQIRVVADTHDGPTGYQANKFLLEGSWNPNAPAKDDLQKIKGRAVGRPSTKTNKASVIDEAERLEQELINEHYRSLNSQRTN